MLLDRFAHLIGGVGRCPGQAAQFRLQHHRTVVKHGLAPVKFFLPARKGVQVHQDSVAFAIAGDVDRLACRAGTGSKFVVLCPQR